MGILEKRTAIQLDKKLSDFYEIRRFIIVLTKSAIGLYPELPEFSPHTLITTFRSDFNIILPPTGSVFQLVFPSGFPNKNLNSFLISAMHALVSFLKSFLI